jgi:hypothetical protein
MKMLTSLAVAALVALGGVAHAKKNEPVILYQNPQSAWWTYKTIGDQGNPLCGMMAFGHGMTFNVKNMSPGDDGPHDGGLYFMIAKTSWQFPKGDGVKVPLAIGFDDGPNEVITADAGGYADDKTGPTVRFTVEERREGDTQAFLEMLAHADKMWIKFKAGNEQPWTIDMRGTRGAVSALRQCFAELLNNKGTQPYASTPDTQPFSLDPKSMKTTKEKQGRDI